MSNELIKKQLPHEILGLGEPVWSKLTPLAQGWLTMASKKVIVFDDLQKNELTIQGELNKIQPIVSKPLTGAETPADMNKWLVEVQDALAAGKTLYESSKAQRLDFTNTINEKLIAPAMAFEKRSDELIKTSVAQELAFRLIVVSKNDEQTNRTEEVASLRAHFQNEHSRLAVEYRNGLQVMIFDAYRAAISSKMNPDMLTTYLDEIRGYMRELKLGKFIKYERRFVSDADAKKIFDEIPAYNSLDDFNSALNDLNTKFAMYEHDLENAEAALLGQQNDLKDTISSNNDQHSKTTAINNLKSSVGELIQTGAPKIKKNMAVVEENTDEWLVSVMTNFIANFSQCKKYTRVSTVSKLTVAQMATALGKLATETGFVFNGLKLTEVKK